MGARPGSDVVEDFRRFSTTYLPALFAAGLFDQVAMPSVAAGVDWTGRIERDPFRRGLRSAAADQLVFIADPAHAARESDRLVRLHRDVRGTAPDGTRFSALHPESWNWILLSTFRMYRGGFELVRGRRLSPEDGQAVWDHFRAKAAGLELDDDRFRLPARYAEMEATYERTARERCWANPTLDRVVAFARRPSPPPQLPRALRPVWSAAVAPVAGRVGTALGFSLLSPDIRAHAGIAPSRLDRAIVDLAAPILRTAYRHLPDRLLLTPLAYHRSRYERLAQSYHDLALTDFRPTEPTGARRLETATG